MKREMSLQESFTLDGVIRLSESKWGRKYTMEISDVLYLHHLVSRNIVNENDMKSYLLKEGFDSIKVLNMIKRYNKVKDDLFQYDWRTQSIMDRVNSYGDAKSVSSWENIDGMVIGLVKENKGYKVCDISNGEEKILARINEGVNWINTNLTNNQMNYIVKNAKILKTQKGIL